MLKHKTRILFFDRFPMFTWKQVTLKGKVRWTNLNQFIKFWIGERKDKKKKIRKLGGLGKREVVKFSVFGPCPSWDATMESRTRAESSRSRARNLFRNSIPNRRDRLLVVVLYTHIYTYARNGWCSKLCWLFTWRVRRDVSCSLKYISNRSFRSHDQNSVLFLVEQPFILDSIAYLKRTS